MAALDRLLTPAEQTRVVEAIGRAERGTSGQIKVHVEGRCAGDALERAKQLFLRLGLDRTQHRNATLIYLAMEDRKFAIVGDLGIHGATGPTFWDAAAGAMTDAFRRGAFGDGLVAAVEKVGEKLAEHFPHGEDDRNEIDDSISTE